MATKGRRSRTAPRRTLVGPIAMLAGGAAVGALVWHVLMIMPPTGAHAWRGAEQLSREDRTALERMLRAHP
jgi:uncharacterized membrane protein